MSALLFWLAVAGAVLDWHYVRAGGQRPARADWRYLLLAILFVVGTLGTLALLGASARGVGEALSLNLTLIFSLWEGRRWRLRRRQPRPYRPHGGKSVTE